MATLPATSGFSADPSHHEALGDECDHFAHLLAHPGEFAATATRAALRLVELGLPLERRRGDGETRRLSGFLCVFPLLFPPALPLRALPVGVFGWASPLCRRRSLSRSRIVRFGAAGGVRFAGRSKAASLALRASTRCWSFSIFKRSRSISRLGCIKRSRSCSVYFLRRHWDSKQQMPKEGKRGIVAFDLMIVGPRPRRVITPRSASEGQRCSGFTGTAARRHSARCPYRAPTTPR